MDHHQLIPVASSTINNEVTPTVNARDLHQFLQVGKDFSNWIKAQIERARLVKDRDFVTAAQKGVGGKFGTIDYHLTIESGKHVAMMSGTDKGFEVREYFIECERRAKQQPAPALPSYPEALRQLAAEIEYREENQHKIDFYHCVTASNDECDMQTVAKILGIPGLGRNILFEILKRLKVLQEDRNPMQYYTNLGYFRVVETPWTNHKTGEQKVNCKTVVTQKGLDFIRALAAHNISPVDGSWRAPARWELPDMRGGAKYASNRISH